MFDVYLPIVALAPAMSYFQPATLSPALRTTLYYIVFALSLVGRPIGATIFGYYGDKFGRRKVTIVSMGGFTLVTLLIALLPGYETLGISSIALLIFLRFIDGVFLGGEYTGANPLAMEYAPKEKRGLWAGIIHTGYPTAIVAMSLLTAGLLRVFPAGSPHSPPHSPYVRFGWRIPFLIGAILSGAGCLYYLRRVPESRVWATAERTSSPIANLCAGNNLRCLLQVFLVMSGAWFTLNAATSILPGVLLTIRNVNSITVTNSQLVTGLALTLGVLVGILGQKIGRRRVIALFGVAGCTAVPAFYYLLVASAYRNPAELILLVTLINLGTMTVWPVLTPYLTERFPTSVRASGYGIGYSAAAIIPAFSGFYMLGLSQLGVPYAYTGIVILALGGLLLVIGVLSGPETRNVEF